MTRIDFRLPSLGADMESATLVEWLKKPGDPVHHGETVASVETEKGIIDIESYEDGEIADVVVQPGTKVPVGTVLAHLSVATRPISGTGAPSPVGREGAGAPASAAAAAPVTPPGTAPPVAPRSASSEHVRRVRISPAARRRAEELGVPIDGLVQLAAGGIIHIEDVERWKAQRSRATPETPPGLPQAPLAAAVDARNAMRVAIGHAMARSKREIPHYYLAHEIDFGVARKWLAEYNERVPVKDRLLEAVLIIKAVALAAAATEGFNGYFREGRFERAAAVHVGSAIAVRGGGLVAPALLEADRKGLPELMRDLSELVSRVRAGHIRSGEFAAATITVTSLGGEGVDVLYPIINPPQVAIVGTGTVRERPWVHEGGLLVRPILTLALAGDHRVTDGRAGARFLQAIAQRLATPDTL